MILKRNLIKCTWQVIGGEESEEGIDYYLDNASITQSDFDLEKSRRCIHQRLAYEHDFGPIHDSSGGTFRSTTEITTQYFLTRWYTKR